MMILNPYQSQGIFRKAQLHLHTSLSLDVFKKIPVKQTVMRYKQAGYHFVVITDHDRITDCPELNDLEFLVIPGIEETIVSGIWPLGKHLIRVNPSDKPFSYKQKKIDSALEDLIIPAHPNWPGNFWTGRWSLSDLGSIPNLRLIEIYNRHSPNRQDLHLWHQLLVERGYKQPVWGIAVDDTDNGDPLDLGWVMVKTPQISWQDLIKGLYEGTFYATCGPEADFEVANGNIFVKTSKETLIHFINASLKIVKEVQEKNASYRPKDSDQFIRIEIKSETGKIAWAQPFFIIP